MIAALFDTALTANTSVEYVMTFGKPVTSLQFDWRSQLVEPDSYVTLEFFFKVDTWGTTGTGLVKPVLKYTAPLSLNTSKLIGVPVPSTNEVKVIATCLYNPVNIFLGLLTENYAY